MGIPPGKIGLLCAWLAFGCISILIVLHAFRKYIVLPVRRTVIPAGYSNRITYEKRPLVWNIWTGEGVHETGEVNWAHIKVRQYTNVLI